MQNYALIGKDIHKKKSNNSTCGDKNAQLLKRVYVYSVPLPQANTNKYALVYIQTTFAPAVDIFFQLKKKKNYGICQVLQKLLTN